MERKRLEQWMERYSKDIYSFCCYLTRNQQEADDLYQDAFVYVLGTSGFPEDDEDAKNLVLSVALRQWKDKKRKYARRQRILEESYIPREVAKADMAGTDSVEEEIIRQEEVQRVRACVEKLPEKMKVVVLLYYMENRKMTEIATMLHLPLGTVKSRLYKSRELLERELLSGAKGGHDQ
jgi:RNA polymerase sigma-70 factor (ECF subfamily)